MTTDHASFISDEHLEVLREQAALAPEVAVSSELLVPMLDELHEHRTQQRKYIARIDVFASTLPEAR